MPFQKKRLLTNSRRETSKQSWKLHGCTMSMGRFSPMPRRNIHPSPPATRHEIDKIRLVLVKKNQPWYRIHSTTNNALHYSRSRFRFDSLAGLFGTLYIAENQQGAFIETFGRVL